MNTTELNRQVDALFDRPQDEGMSLALVVQQHGAVVAERYGAQPANDFQAAQTITAESTLVSWSMAKSITHAAVGILVKDGLLDLDAPAAVPSWIDSPKAQITLLDLLEMRSGLHFIEDYIDGDTSNCIEMLFGGGGPSHADYAAALPLVHEPGAVWNYSSGTSNIIARIVGDTVHRAAHGTLDATPNELEASMRTFLDERLFAPVGMDSAEPKFDGAGTFVGSSFVYATALDFAKFGELYRHDGVTLLGQGERILPTGWLDHARTKVAHDPENGFDYGRHWWMWPDIAGSLSCHGYEGQFIVVDPDREVVLVHLGKTDTSVAPDLVRRLRGLLNEF